MAVRLLALRAHGEEELRRKLLRRGCVAEDVEAALAQLRGSGYLDDLEVARSLVRRRSQARGRALIAQELISLGISREVTAQALAELSEQVEAAAARHLIESEPGLQQRRLAGRLQRRGFAPWQVRRLLAERSTDENAGDGSRPGRRSFSACAPPVGRAPLRIFGLDIQTSGCEFCICSDPRASPRWGISTFTTE